jgi:capsular exopolysaccharide synthesis family protein
MTENYMDPIEHEEERQVHLRDYLVVLRKRKMTIILSLVVIMLTAAVFTFTATPVYKSSARVIIEKEQQGYISFEDFVGADSSGRQYYQTQYQIIKSRPIARRVIADLNLTEHPAFNPEKNDDSSWISDLKEVVKKPLTGVRESLAGLLDTSGKQAGQAPEVNVEMRSRTDKLIGPLLSRISVEPVKDSQLVKIGFQSQDPDLCAQVANAVAKVYMEYNLDMKLSAVRDATEWLQQRVQEEREKVEDAERRLQKYKEAHGIVTGFSTESEQMTAQRLGAVNSQVVEAEARRVEAETRYRQTKELMDKGTPLDSIPVIMNNELIMEMKTSEVELSKRLAELSGRYGPNHPRIKAIKSELQTLREKKEAEIRQVINSLRNEYEVALARERSLKSSLSEIKNEAQQLNEKAIEYGVLKRQAESARQMYDVLIKRFKESSLSEEIKTGNIRIMDEAVVPSSPIKPNPQQNMMLALVLGLALGVGGAFFLEYLDNTIKSPDDVKNHLGVPYLAPIPMVDEAHGERELVSHAFPKSTASEAFRGLRTNILFSSADHPPQVILVSSPGPGDGKTLSSINLAITMAQYGSKVLLLDGDLRRPRIHKIFGLSRDNGVSNVLAGSVDQNAAVIQSTDIPNLSVITSGPVPPNPSELLGSKRMTKFLDMLRERYDRIIIDCTPVTAVTDASVLASFVDGVVVVLKANESTKEVARSALEGLDRVKAKVLGVVLNAVDLSKESSYYYHYYYYYYGEDGGKKKKRSKRRKKQQELEV